LHNPYFEFAPAVVRTGSVMLRSAFAFKFTTALIFPILAGTIST
jgi:hypothetical protein